jgi:hypothetical protein
LSSWAPFGPSGEGEDGKDKPLWSGEDPAPPARPEPESAAAEPEPEPEPEKPAYEPPTPPPFPAQPTVTPGDPLVGRATPPPRAEPDWPPPPPSQPPERGPLKTPTNATLSLVFGVLGLLVCPVILSVAAIGTGMSAKRQIDANPRYSGRGVAQTGIVLGAVGLAIWIVFFLIGLLGYLGIGGGI